MATPRLQVRPGRQPRWHVRLTGEVFMDRTFRTYEDAEAFCLAASESYLAYPDDEWRPIPGFSGYEASDQGRVRTRGQRPRVLKQRVSRMGYLNVSVRRDGGSQAGQNVHVLVAAAFHGPRPAGLVTRHLDGVQTNNIPSNLAYGTQSENILDAVRHGTHPSKPRTHCKKAGHPLTPENVYTFTAGRRCCRPCAIERARITHARKRAERTSSEVAA